MEKYICIHGHFYQPPRENPWLESIEQQDSAHPYHDWNERITAECYAPNGAARIQNGNGRITEIVNNYARMSFNFGPTLLAWMESNASDAYQAVLEADRESARRFSGHGSAIAQVYNHMILPLASRRDKVTQIRWGISDFERRFGRKPEGMWLAEAAVDLETLDILAEHGISFTVLAPSQAKRARDIGGRKWRDLNGGQIDPSMAYLQRLRSGRSINLFFYDGPVSQAVAFEGLLKSGETFANRLLSTFSDSRTWPQLGHIATDGETYGHHHAHGDMALAYALHHIESNHLARLTNYAEFLERQPPCREVEIHENSSWSCIHGVERWRSDCGCNSGMKPGWRQGWRGPLRDALDWLRDELAQIYERRAGSLFKDAWAARDAAIQLVLDRSDDSVQSFFAQHAARPLSEAEVSAALQLLEMQRHAMLMYTSCGWFFDELSGIETVQVIQYAARALQLAAETAGAGLEESFANRLERAKSNLPEHGDGRNIYSKFVKPAMVDLPKVAAHYAVSSLFESYPQETAMYCYSVAREDFRLLSSGRVRLALGRAQVRSQIDRTASTYSFGVFHLGDHIFSGGVRVFQGEDAYGGLCRQLTEIFERGDFPELLREVDRIFGSGTYTLKLLFRDEQRKVLNRIIEAARTEANATYRQLYDHYAPLMRFLRDAGMATPRRIQVAAEFTLNTELIRAVEAEPLPIEQIRARMTEAKNIGVSLDEPLLEFRLRRTLERLARRTLPDPLDAAVLEGLNQAVGLAKEMPFAVNLWTLQNIFATVLQPQQGEQRARADQGDKEAQRWTQLANQLADRLQMQVNGS